MTTAVNLNNYMAASAQVQAALDHLLQSYSANFDIYHDYNLLGSILPAFASFHSRGERYVLSKKAKLWAAECNEHALFFVFDKLDLSALKQITTFLETAEKELVLPHSEHMYTYLSAIILAHSADDQAIELLNQYKFRKSYLFSLRGWCHGRLALYTLADKQAYSNKDGRELRNMLTDHMQKFALP